MMRKNDLHMEVNLAIINPRRAWAARVTVLGVSVCLSTATRLPMSDANGYASLKNKLVIFLKRLHSRDMP